MRALNNQLCSNGSFCFCFSWFSSFLFAFSLFVQWVLSLAVIGMLLVHLSCSVQGKPAQSSASVEASKHSTTDPVPHGPTSSTEPTTEATRAHVNCRHHKNSNAAHCRHGRRVHCRPRPTAAPKPTKVYMQLPNMFISHGWGPGI